MLNCKKVIESAGRKRKEETCTTIQATADLTVNVYDILKEIRDRQLRANVDKKDCLIPIFVTNVDSPTAFWVQLSQPEVLNYFMKFEGKMNTELQESKTDPLINEDLEVNELCLFYLEKDEERYWLRGYILEKPAIEITAKGDFVKYNVFACDYGRTYWRLRREIQKVDTNSKFFIDPPYAIRCHLPGLTPTGGGIGSSWTKAAIEMFTKSILQCKDALFILVKDHLPEQQPESVAVNVVAKQTVIRGATDPEEMIYCSLIDLLKQQGLAMDSIKQNRALVDDGAELNCRNVPDHDIVKVAMPFSYANDSILSQLRRMHITNDVTPQRVLSYEDAKLPNSNHFEVICTAIGSPLNIYFRLWDKELIQPMQTINETISNVLSEKDSLSPFVGETTTGTSCSAYFKYDNTWNRAEIIGVLKDQRDARSIKVKFVDYGNVERLSLKNISSDVFNCDIPKLALCAKLYNLEPFSWEVEAKLIEKLHTLLVDKICSVHWENSPQVPMKISITLPDDRSLKMVLLNENLMKEITVTDEEYPREMQSLTEFLNACPYPGNELKFNSNEFYPVEISHFAMNNYIFVQFLKIEDTYDAGVCQINDQHNNFLLEQENMREGINLQRKISVKEMRPGLACAAQFEDYCWYRAVIKHVMDDGKCEVIFVDYGNTSILDNERLREIKSCYVDRPYMHAILCKLTNIKPKEFRWHCDIVKKLSDIFTHPPKKMHLIAKLKRPSPSMPLEVDLYWARLTDPRVPMECPLQQLVDYNFIDFINSNIPQEEIANADGNRRNLANQENPNESFEPPVPLLRKARRNQLQAFLTC